MSWTIAYIIFCVLAFISIAFAMWYQVKVEKCYITLREATVILLAFVPIINIFVTGFILYSAFIEISEDIVVFGKRPE
jgi:hypothetical protein